MDFAILDFIQTHIRCDVLDKVMPVITKLGNGGAIWIAASILLLIFPKTRRLGFSVIASLVIEVLCCNIILKPIVARIRPCEVNKTISLLISRPTDYSFPSGHTGASFAAASAMLFAKNRLWVPSMIVALLIGFSRLYLYVHYPTDVFAGMLIGIMAGFFGEFIIRKIDERVKKLHENKIVGRNI